MGLGQSVTACILDGSMAMVLKEMMCPRNSTAASAKEHLCKRAK